MFFNIQENAFVQWLIDLVAAISPESCSCYTLINSRPGYLFIRCYPELRCDDPTLSNFQKETLKFMTMSCSKRTQKNSAEEDSNHRTTGTNSPALFQLKLSWIWDEILKIATRFSRQKLAQNTKLFAWFFSTHQNWWRKRDPIIGNINSKSSPVFFSFSFSFSFSIFSSLPHLN